MFLPDWEVKIAKKLVWSLFEEISYFSPWIMSIGENE